MAPARRERGACVCGAVLALVTVCATSLDATAQAQTRRRVLREAEVVRQLARAERELARGRTDRALALLEALAERAPSDPRPPERFCGLAVPETDATVEAFAEDPARIGALAARCERLVARQRASGAPAPALSSLADWAAALGGAWGPWLDRVEGRAIDERDVPGLRRIAALAARAGDLDAAERALGLARRVRPGDLEVTSALAAVRLARGDAVGAVPLFRAVAAERPADPAAIQDLAGALLQAGEMVAAVRTLEALVGARPDDVEAWLALARARTELGAFERAAADARRALALSDEADARAALALGDALRLAGDLAAARSAYEEALRRDPRSVRARAALAAP